MPHATRKPKKARLTGLARARSVASPKAKGLAKARAGVTGRKRRPK